MYIPISSEVLPFRTKNRDTISIIPTLSSQIDGLGGLTPYEKEKEKDALKYLRSI